MRLRFGHPQRRPGLGDARLLERDLDLVRFAVELQQLLMVQLVGTGDIYSSGSYVPSIEIRAMPQGTNYSVEVHALNPVPVTIMFSGMQPID